MAGAAAAPGRGAFFSAVQATAIVRIAISGAQAMGCADMMVSSSNDPSNRDSERLLELVVRQHDWISLHTARLSRRGDDARDVLIADSVGREPRHTQILDEAA